MGGVSACKPKQGQITNISSKKETIYQGTKESQLSWKQQRQVFDGLSSKTLVKLRPLAIPGESHTTVPI